MRQKDFQFDEQGNLLINPDLQLHIGVHIPLGSDGKRGRPEDAWGLTKNWKMIVMDKDDGTFKTKQISEEVFTGLTADTMLAAMADLGVGEIKWGAYTFLNEDWELKATDSEGKPLTLGAAQKIIDAGQANDELTGTARRTSRQILEDAGIEVDDDDDDDGDGDGTPPGGLGTATVADPLYKTLAEKEEAAQDIYEGYDPGFTKGGLVKKPTRSSRKRKNGKGLAKRK
jgi:hypothetical protein